MGKGLEQGLERGRHNGELNVLLRQIEKRFGGRTDRTAGAPYPYVRR